MPATILGNPLPIIQEHPGGSSSRGSHRLMSAVTCEQHWVYRYIKGIRPRFVAPWTMTGSLFHLHMAYHYAERLKPRPPDWFYARTLTQRIRDLCPNEEHAKLRDVAIAMSSAYKTRYLDETWEPLAVETERHATLGEIDPGGPWPELDNEIVTCRNDLEVSPSAVNDHVAIVDFKTQAMYGSNLPRWDDDENAFRLDFQACLNLIITRAHYARYVPEEFAPRPVRMFVIVRAGRKEPYKFDRHVLQIPLQVYKYAPRMARFAVATEARIYDRAKRGTPIYPTGVARGACVHRYGSCEFADLCCAPTEVDRDELLTKRFLRPLDEGLG